MPIPSLYKIVNPLSFFIEKHNYEKKEQKGSFQIFYTFLNSLIKDDFIVCPHMLLVVNPGDSKGESCRQQQSHLINCVNQGFGDNLADNDIPWNVPLM